MPPRQLAARPSRLKKVRGTAFATQGLNMTHKKIVTTVFGIKNCDTMKKALAWLTEHGIAFEFIDYKKAGVAEQHLPDWAARAGWETLLNTRGLMWKKLTDEERSAVDAAKALKLMAQYPALIKRPVLDTGTVLLVGFSPEKYAEALR